MSETNYPNAIPQRPTFLTVVCIIGFLFGAWMLVSSVRTAFTDKPQADLERTLVEMEEARDEMGSDVPQFALDMLDGAVLMAEKTVEQARPIGITGLALALLSIFGIWQMWNLRKAGFWLYLVTSLLGLVSTFFFLGSGLVVVFAVAFMAFLSLILIILYAVNLKHMR
jgi:hypothetical protein